MGVPQVRILGKDKSECPTCSHKFGTICSCPCSVHTFLSVTHLAIASCGLMHGNAAFTDIAWVLVASAAVTAVLAPLAVHMYYRER